MKNYRLILIVIAFSIPWNLFAQENLWYERNLAAYTDYISKEFGIICKMPEKSTDLEIFYIGCKIQKDRDKRAGNVYGPVFLSENKECVVMYSVRPTYCPKEDRARSRRMELPGYPRSQITAEIKTALGLYYGPRHPLNNDAAKFDFNEY